MKNIIFDLDLTLVDTTICEPSRHERNWQQAYALIPKCTLYEGIDEVFAIIRKFGIKSCIVSTSPRPYVGTFIKYYKTSQLIHTQSIANYLAFLYL